MGQQSSDPRERIRDKQVTVRAAAVRELQRVGKLDDLDLLVGLAIQDKSPAVRLYAAAAAADVVGRFRGAAGQQSLGPSERQAIHDRVRRVDPATNPGLLMLLSATADKRSLDRLGRMLRDPRNLVRGGAAMALRRMAISGGALGRDDIAASVRSCIGHPKMKADSLGELVRLIGEVGWLDLEDAVRRAAPRVNPEAVSEAMERLDQRRRPSAYDGIWQDEGLDVVEINDEPRPGGWLAVAGGSAHRPGGEAPFELEDGRSTIGGSPARLVWASQLGAAQDRVEAIQVEGATYWSVPAATLVAEVDSWVGQLTPGGAGVALATVAAVEGAPAARARVALAWRAERSDAAADDLAWLLGQRRPRADVHFWHARILVMQGDAEGAKAAIETFLGRAGKRTGYVEEANELLQTL